MAKKTDAAPAATLTADDREYARCVIRKQCQLDDDASAKRLAELSDQQVAELVECGRRGCVDKCRALLGCCDA